MYVVGIDENGLGPRLGPMVTTAVTVALAKDYRAEYWRDRGLKLGLTDSKATSSSRKMAFAESVALALVVGDPTVGTESAAAFLGALHLDGTSALRAPCPTNAARSLCHGHDLALPAFGGSIEEGRDIVGPLLRGRTSLRIVRVRSVLNCVGVLNAAHEAGRNKLVLDLAAMERLAIDAAHAEGTEVEAICGMIGGIRDVPRFATAIARADYESLEETRTRRAYRVRGVGTMAFEVDADARHLPVALASLVGKYVRELGMRRVTGGLAQHDPTLGSPSGYHDPVTARFVDASTLLRTKLGIVDDCFERRA